MPQKLSLLISNQGLNHYLLSIHYVPGVWPLLSKSCKMNVITFLQIKKLSLRGKKMTALTQHNWDLSPALSSFKVIVSPYLFDFPSFTTRA